MRAGAGVSSISLLRTGRRRNRRRVGVVGFWNEICLIRISADAGVGGIAALGTGGRSHYRSVGVIAKTADLACVSASGGIPVLFGVIRIGRSKGMARGNGVRLIGVAAVAGISSVAVLGTGGRSHYRGVGVIAKTADLACVSAGSGIPVLFGIVRIG